VINEAELHSLESTLLPALERHHLRLLAHGLRTLQAVGPGPGGGLPSRAALEHWAASQPAIAADPSFRCAFVEQMLSLGVQLEAIAAGRARGPLDLELEDLVRWARQQADRRLSDPKPANPPPG
jgi:hypothetical protein